MSKLFLNLMPKHAVKDPSGQFGLGTSIMICDDHELNESENEGTLLLDTPESTGPEHCMLATISIADHRPSPNSLDNVNTAVPELNEEVILKSNNIGIPGRCRPISRSLSNIFDQNNNPKPGII